MKMQMLAAAFLVALCVAPQHVAAQSGTGESQFRKARELLTGADKNEPEAKRLLLEAIDDPSLGANSRCYADVYLGYIEDRAKNREEAIAWYTRALEITSADSGILDVAKVGLTRPITWIRHLDDVPPPPALPPAPANALKIGRGYVTDIAPEGLVRAQKLSPAEWRENFDILWEAVDRTYACFNLKSIDWQNVRLRFEKRLESTETTADFYFLLFNLVNELKDTHSWIQSYSAPTPSVGPGVSLDLFEGKPFVIALNPLSEAAAAGVKAGSEVLEIDGLTVGEKMETLRPYLGGFSSERAYQRRACWYLLAGASGTSVTVKLRTPDGETESYSLKRAFSLGIRPVIRNFPFELSRQRFVHFGRHPSGAGYIQIESFNGREEIADEFDKALEKLGDTPGLIIDVRDNTGGYGNSHARIIGRFLDNRVLGHISYAKAAPEYLDFRRSEGYFRPIGERYTRPVALLINDVTGSAADLFTCDMRSVPGLVTIGCTTHGNLSGVAVYAVLPCGAVVRISNGYISDPKEQPIEVNGSTPDIPVSTTVLDFLNGRDPVLDMAAAVVGSNPAR